MSRPRIRTLKPEIWAHEKLGRISRDERVLFVGLITLADDRGRLRELPDAIRGHVFPYDRISAKRLERWLQSLHRVRLITRYGTGRERFIHVHNFNRHQVVNKPRPSELPPPPGAPSDDAQGSLLPLSDVATEAKNSRTATGALPERSGGDQERIKEQTPPKPPPGGSAAQAWSLILAAARGHAAPSVVGIWLEPLVPVSLEGGVLTLRAPDDRAALVRERYGDWLGEVGRAVGIEASVAIAESERERAARTDREAKQARRDRRAARAAGRSDAAALRALGPGDERSRL